MVIRGLNTDDISTSNALSVIWREAIAGAFLGLMLGIIVIGWAYIIAQGNLNVALTVGISLVAISILASTAGGSLPILFRAMGFDPALMSSPFITTIVEVIGVLLYLTLARYMLG